MTESNGQLKVLALFKTRADWLSEEASKAAGEVARLDKEIGQEAVRESAARDRLAEAERTVAALRAQVAEQSARLRALQEEKRAAERTAAELAAQARYADELIAREHARSQVPAAAGQDGGTER